MAASSLVRPPSASLIVRSLSKPPLFPHNSWNASVRSRRLEMLDLQAFLHPRCRRSTACHAEGRGFESLQPLLRKPAHRAGFCVSARRARITAWPGSGLDVLDARAAGNNSGVSSLGGSSSSAKRARAVKGTWRRLRAVLPSSTTSPLEIVRWTFTSVLSRSMSRCSKACRRYTAKHGAQDSRPLAVPLALRMESASGQLAASMDSIACYGDEERLSAASIRSSRLSS